MESRRSCPLLLTNRRSSGYGDHNDNEDDDVVGGYGAGHGDDGRVDGRTD